MPRKQMPAAELAAKKELALEVIERLKAEYPDAACTLDYADAWQLLVSVRLAAQCTDARVNVVVEDLFAKYPGVAAQIGRASCRERRQIAGDAGPREKKQTEARAQCRESTR